MVYKVSQLPNVKMKIIRENNMKFLPNIIPAAITHHHGFLLLLVAIFTTVILRFSLTPAVFHQNLILTQTKYYMNMVSFLRKKYYLVLF